MSPCSRSLIVLTIGVIAGVCTECIVPADSGRAFMIADPNQTDSLTPWDHLQIGNKSYKVSQFPTGYSGVAIIGIVDDPLGEQGKVYKLSVTAEAQFQAGTNLLASEAFKHLSDRVDLWNTPKPYMGQEGQETWEHFRILFRSSGQDAYRPSPGSWNWLVQHHNDPRYKSFVESGAIKGELPELAWGVDTKSKKLDVSLTPELFMRVRGGDDLHQLPDTNVFVGSPLLLDHWYDILVHVVWSHDPQKGLVEWWLDGRSIFSKMISNLWLRPDGSTDHVNFEYSNYRKHTVYDSTVYFSGVRLGPNHDSVAF